MPLLDHFHPPIHPARAWESFHTMWVSEIAGALNQDGLPPDYFAEAQLNFGGRVEVDVATMVRETHPHSGTGPNEGGVAVQTEVETGTMIMPAVFPDEAEVLIFRRFGG